MNEHQLSSRLQAVAAFVPTGCRLADIGSDHAYLPVHLAVQGQISMAIAGELNDGPLQSAQNQVEKLGLEGVIEVRQGNGLEVIQDYGVDVVVMAGMGGSLITQILSQHPEQLDKLERIILQPNVAGHVVRKWLMEHDWELKDENIVQEGDNVYEVLMAEPGVGQAPYTGLDEDQREQALLMGPLLLKEKSDAFICKWTRELKKRKKIISALQHAQSEENQRKLKQVQNEWKRIKEGLEYECERSDNHPMA